MLIADWSKVLRRAWSVRLIVAAAVLSGVEVTLSLTGGLPGVPGWIFAVMSGLVSASAFVARLTAQRSMTDADPAD